MTERRWRISKRFGKLRGDRRLVWLLILFAGFVGVRGWLADNPGDDPWAPLDLRDEPGWTTERKLVALRDDPAQCRDVLGRSKVAFSTLDPVGDGACRRENRTRLDEFPLAPDRPATTCSVAAALEVWLERGVQPAARQIYGQDVQRIEHLGAYSCRRLYGDSEGPWSEHATANAIDISAFVLEDGSRISLLGNWNDEDDDAKFLRRARDEACGVFGTVLSPDYNAAHADHFHFDQKGWGFGGVCR